MSEGTRSLSHCQQSRGDELAVIEEQTIVRFHDTLSMEMEEELDRLVSG